MSAYARTFDLNCSKSFVELLSSTHDVIKENMPDVYVNLQSTYGFCYAAVVIITLENYFLYLIEAE